MANVYRAARQFERFLGYGILDKRYIPPQPAPLEDSQLVAIILYDNKNQKVRVERKA